MSLPRPGSSYPGYYPNLPTRPPDMGDIKGEYIEDVDGIKEEENRLMTPGPSAIPPEFLARPSWPGSWPGPCSAPPLVTAHPMSGPRGHAPRGLIPPLTSSLTPLQLIQKLSSYAASNNSRKRAPPSSSDPAKSPPSKRIPVSSPGSLQPRIEQVMSLHDKSKEANNNSSTSPPAVPDLAPSKSMIDCPVCGDIAVAHFHYGGMCCYSCKAFFRRVVNTNKVMAHFLAPTVAQEVQISVCPSVRV